LCFNFKNNAPFGLFINWLERQAYLHQELEKLQEPEDGKFRAEGGGGASIGDAGEVAADVKSISVARASQLWGSLLAHTGWLI
jgi:hypothetical protein